MSDLFSRIRGMGEINVYGALSGAEFNGRRLAILTSLGFTTAILASASVCLNHPYRLV